MTLKEKLRQLIYPNHIHINEISDWTDSYAIEFAEWLQSNCYSLIEGNYVFRHNTFKTIRLLEIFKKEKRL